eukprot:6711370-Prymnesium_polylepis.1
MSRARPTVLAPATCACAGRSDAPRTSSSSAARGHLAAGIDSSPSATMSRRSLCVVAIVRSPATMSESEMAR